MPDEDAAPTTEASDASATPADADPPTPQTVEEVEALWKNRVSQKDKAHAAAEKVLRDEVAALRSAQASAQPNGEVAQQEAQKRIAELERQVEEERVKTLQMKYPVLAEQVGDDTSLFKTTDEATLAKLNALGAQPGQPAPVPLMEHSTPKRGASVPASDKPKTSEELKGQLALEEASWKESIGYGEG